MVPKTVEEFYNRLDQSDLLVTFQSNTGACKVVRVTANVLETFAGESKFRSSYTDSSLIQAWDSETSQWVSFYLRNVEEVVDVNSQRQLLQEDFMGGF